MPSPSHIGWTDDSWNPWDGCEKVSEGCLNCYIERQTPMRVTHRSFDAAGIGGSIPLQFYPDRMGWPLKIRKRRKIFVNSMSDLFHDDAPDYELAKVFAVMAVTPHLTYQITTKRPARMRSLLNSDAFHHLVQTTVPSYSKDPDAGQDYVTTNWPLPNVWQGVSAETQKWADIRLRILADTRAAIRWVSAEPLLEPLDLTPWLGQGETTLDWVVYGGESGPKTRHIRPMHPTWARSLRDQCIATDTPQWFKQWGEWGPADWYVPVCDRETGWTGTPAELAAAKKASEAVGATHAMPVWSHQYGHMITELDHKPWSLERSPTGPPATHAGMRRWGKKAASNELDGVVWEQFPREVAADAVRLAAVNAVNSALPEGVLTR